MKGIVYDEKEKEESGILFGVYHIFYKWHDTFLYSRTRR